MEKETPPPSSFKKLFKTVFSYGGVIVLLLVVLSWWQTDRDSLAKVSFLDLQAQYSQLNEFPLVLRFVTTSCSICQFENDNVGRAERWAAVNIVNVVVGAQPDKAIAYLQHSQLNVDKSIIDDKGLLFRQFHGKAVPLTVFVDSEKQVHHLTLGYTSTAGFIARYWLSYL